MRYLLGLVIITRSYVSEANEEEEETGITLLCLTVPHACTDTARRQVACGGAFAAHSDTARREVNIVTSA